MAKINIFDNFLKDDAYLFIKPVVELGIFTFMNSADGKINHTYEYQVVNLGVPYRDGNIKQMMGTQDRVWSWDGYLTSTEAMTAHQQMEAIEMLLKNGLPVSLVYLGHCWNVVIKSFTANILRECRVDYSITVEEYIPTYMQYKPAKIIPIIPPEYGIISPPGNGGGGIPTNPNDPCVDDPCSEVRFICDTSNPIIYDEVVIGNYRGSISGPNVDTNRYVDNWISITKGYYHEEYQKEWDIHNSWIKILREIATRVISLLYSLLLEVIDKKANDLIKQGKLQPEDKKKLMHCFDYISQDCLELMWWEALNEYMTTPCVLLKGIIITGSLFPPHYAKSILEATAKGYMFNKELLDILKESNSTPVSLQVRLPIIEISERCLNWCLNGGQPPV